jgi:hypothetical protein
MTPNSQSNLPLGNGATPLFADPFTGATSIENKWTVLKAGTSKSPGLTASGTTTVAAGEIPGFASPASDTAGNGVLRLTDNTASQSGAVIYNQSLFSKAGISIDFEYFQYGGTAVGGKQGDGISFFLLDGAQATPTQAGGFGGGLGYAQNSVLNQGGIAGGYLGIGFDSFGNFGQGTEGRVGGGTGDTSDRVTIRGSSGTQYKYLTSSNTIAATSGGTANGGIDNDTTGANRSNSGRLVRIEIAADGKLTVKFDLNGNKVFDANENVIDGYDTIAGGNSILPDTVKFGFAASTGGATNFQEIRELKISSVADLFTGGGGTVNHTASTASVAIAPALAINTVVVPTPTSTFNGATVGITPATYKTGQDFLTVGTVTANTPATSGTFTGSGLTWAFNATTGVLTVSGAGTPAQYQDALKQVSYYNNAGAAAVITDRTAQYVLTGIAGTPSTTATIKVLAGNTVAKRPEILFQNASGEVALWTVDTKGVLTGAKFVTFGAGFGTNLVGKNLVVPTGWKVIDTGDVDKDGVADILWFNPNTQETAIHFMTNDGVLKAGDFIRTSATAPTLKVAVADQWSPVGLTDVTGDGTLDITWRAAATDLIAYWTVAGTTSTVLTGGGYLQTTAGTADYKTGDNSRGVKMGDFDGDGKATDMLLSNGKVVFIGAFTGGKLLAKGSAQLPSNGDTSLVVRAVGDYNVDGTTDLAWESPTADKQVLEYLKVTTGAFDPAAANFKSLPQTGANWTLGASKDFNADVASDLVWYNTATGEVAIWAIDKLTGGLVTDGSTAYVTFNGARLKTPAGWSVVGADDFGTLPIL